MSCSVAPGNEDGHYTGTIEPIDFIEAQGLDFCEGSAVKYICRWKKKGGAEDLKKARWYIERLIKSAEPTDDNEHKKEREKKFPRIYERLSTMIGITEEERVQCLRDFYEIGEKYLNDTDKICTMFNWHGSPSGDNFWDTIDDKVNTAEQGQE